MNRFVRCLLCLVLCFALLPATGLAQQAVTNTKCKYYSAESPCDIIWYVDSVNRMHCEACKNHVEDKEAYNYVTVTEWTACTLNNDEDGECIVCGWDYIKDVSDDDYTEAYMIEKFMYFIEAGISPLTITISGNTATVEFSQYYLDCLAEWGIWPSESMCVPTTYTLTLSGTSFEATGSAITPATLSVSEYGPASWASNYGFSVSGVQYSNNVNPGTATAYVTFSLEGFDSQTLSVTFTITGDEAYTDQEITSEDDSVSISGELSQGSTIELTPVGTDDPDYEKLMGTLDAEDYDVLAALDVSINGSYNGALELTFGVDEEYNGKTITVLHGKADDTVETLTDTAEDGEVTVTVTELSPFILLAEKEEEEEVQPQPTVTPEPTVKPDVPVKPDTPEKPEKPEKPQQPGKPEAPEASAAPEAPQLPKTGDNSMPMLWLALMALAAIGFAFTSGKRLGSR